MNEMACAVPAFYWIAGICTTKAMSVIRLLRTKLDRRANNEAHGTFKVDNH